MVKAFFITFGPKVLGSVLVGGSFSDRGLALGILVKSTAYLDLLYCFANLELKFIPPFLQLLRSISLHLDYV